MHSRESSWIDEGAKMDCHADAVLEEELSAKMGC